MVPVFYQRQIDLTAEAPAQGPLPDIVIWPETSVPWLLEYAGEAFAEIAQAANGAQVILGVQRRDDLGRWYNALVLLEPDGAVGAVYDKHHLVPFGEYMPFMEVFARWEIFGLAVNDTGGYAAGPGPALIDLGRAGKALPLICYEAIFPNDIAREPGRADWLVQITNDAWFGRYAGPYQHMALARLRAVEQGLPMMRAANTGVSAAFDPYGRILGQIPLGEAGAIDISLSAPLPPTAYARYGDLPVSGLLVFLASVIAFAGRRRISG
jgi:apolipoprotein N-acyltransferase